jgi:Gpi18-like mannosyltransferase
LAVVVFAFVKKILKGKKKSALLFASLVLFNPALIYSSAYWGQIESTPLVFLMLAFYFLMFSKRAYLSAIFLTLALLTKQTTIIFIPIYAIIYFKKYGLMGSIKGSAASLFVFFLAFLPFYKSGNIITFPYLTYWNKIQTGSGSDYVTDHAFNMWALLTGLGKISDSTRFALSTYRVWGYLIFIGLFAATLPRLAIKKINKQNILLVGTIIAIGAFLFLTRMHSRYLAQALPFVLVLAAYKKIYFYLYAFLSAFLFINMYHNWWAPRVDLFVNLFSSTYFINSMIVALIGIFFALLYKYLRTDYAK